MVMLTHVIHTRSTMLISKLFFSPYSADNDSQLTPEDVEVAKKDIDQVLSKIRKGEIQGLKPIGQEQPEDKQIETLGNPSTDSSEKSTPEMPRKLGGPPKMRRPQKRRRGSEDDDDDDDGDHTPTIDDMKSEDGVHAAGASTTIVIPSSGSSSNTDPSPSNEMIDLTQQ